MSRNKKRKKSNNSGAIVGMTIALILITGVIAVVAHSLFGSGRTLPEPSAKPAREAESATPTPTPTPTPEAEEEIPEEERTYFESGQLHAGDLVLVTSEYPFSFKDAADDLVEIATHKEEGSIPVTEEGMMMAERALIPLEEMVAACDAEVQGMRTGVASAYHTEEYQQDVWDQYEQLYGEEYVKTHVAVPGYSEHHTGLAADLTALNRWDGEETFSGSPNAEWMDAHCAEYGFVRRYKAEKADVTGINNEDWHFRYVGRAHAAYMNSYDLCLEEYIDLLREHPEEDALLVHADKDYKIWFTTEDYIRTPDKPFTVSGNNIDGYIITETEG